MDIPAISTAMSQIDLQDKIGAALFTSVKDMAEQQGEALVEMIEAVPAPPGVGEHIDISV